MKPQLTGLFTAIGELIKLSGRFRHIEGWLGDDEGYLLYLLARDANGAGAIVEIGSWMGRSTAWLAAGSMAAGREHVYAVDLFDGGPMLKHLEVIRQEGTTYHRFVENLEQLGLFDHVEPIVGDSQEAARNWTGGDVRLLFIDGNHDYAAVKADFELWTRHMPAGGIVVFDDAEKTYPGVLQFIDELKTDTAGWQHLLDVGKTAAWQRIA